jgi:hypothetical protein
MSDTSYAEVVARGQMTVNEITMDENFAVLQQAPFSIANMSRGVRSDHAAPPREKDSGKN